MTTISIRDLKAHTSAILKDVITKQKEIIVTRHGHPYGKIIPISENVIKQTKHKKDLRGSFHKLPPIQDEDFYKIKKIWKSD